MSEEELDGADFASQGGLPQVDAGVASELSAESVEGGRLGLEGERAQIAVDPAECGLEVLSIVGADIEENKRPRSIGDAENEVQSPDFTAGEDRLAAAAVHAGVA